MKVRITLGVVLTLVALGFGLTAASAHGLPLGVEPAIVVATVAPGGSLDVVKTVHTPQIPPKLDLFLLIDLSGSYGEDITNIREADDGIFDSVRLSVADSRFGVGSFVDYPFSPWGRADTGDYGYQRDQDLTTDKATWTGAIDGLVVRFGDDFPESQYEGLYQAATGAGRDVPSAGPSLGDIAAGLAPSWRAEAAKVIALTTDASFHTPGDSSCTTPPLPCPFDYPGPSRDQTVAALNGLGIKVIAIKAPGSGGEMDDIAGATGGSVQTTGSTSAEIADAILTGLGNLPVTVAPRLGTCDAGLSVTFDVASQVVVSGADASFTETIMVALDAAQGAALHCTVLWQIDGVDPGPEFVEQITINVPGIALEPAVDTNEAGTSHTVTATVIAGGTPLAGMPTVFKVTAGPNADETSGPGECAPNADCMTDAVGSVSWTYTGDFLVGTDTIRACFTFEGVELCDTASKEWIDTTSPDLNTPPDAINEATGPDGATHEFVATATDAVDPNPVVVCTPPSGSTFPLGDTVVTCTATDASGNVSQGTFTKTVVDTTPPDLDTPPDTINEATGPDGATLEFVATATDAVDPNPVVVCAPPSGSTFPLGDTVVTCTATDASGNVSQGTFTKTVLDTTPPVAACTPTTNPSGQNVPPAGNNPKSGQNPDGFFELTASDSVGPNPQIFVGDSGSSFVAGPYPSGTTIKLVQAPGATPNVKPGAGAIAWKITLQGDAIVYAVAASGNQSHPVSCLVPPLPK